MNDADLISSLIPAVEQQIESPETPLVREILERLINEEGINENDAKEMIAICLADESNRMFVEKRDFDLDRYQELLDSLPWLEEEE